MKIDGGDTAWLLTSAALVMFMTVGLALFYGGLVRAKNVIGTIMQSFVALALVTVIWVVVSGLNAGTILAFSEEHEKALRPIVLGVTVPALLYLVLWAWQRVRRKPPE